MLSTKHACDSGSVIRGRDGLDGVSARGNKHGVGRDEALLARKHIETQAVRVERSDHVSLGGILNGIAILGQPHSPFHFCITNILR